MIFFDHRRLGCCGQMAQGWFYQGFWQKTRLVHAQMGVVYEPRTLGVKGKKCVKIKDLQDGILPIE